MATKMHCFQSPNHGTWTKRYIIENRRGGSERVSESSRIVRRRSRSALGSRQFVAGMRSPDVGENGRRRAILETHRWMFFEDACVPRAPTLVLCFCDCDFCCVAVAVAFGCGCDDATKYNVTGVEASLNI